VIIPEENKKDLMDIPGYVKKRLRFIPVKNMDDVVRLIFS